MSTAPPASHNNATNASETINATVNTSSDIFSSVSGALGRSMTRAMALYFARPVRLFRPSKVNGWMTLQSAAKMQNASLSPQYLSLLIRTEGWKIIPRHFLPPLIVNSALGAILFETFTVSNRRLRKRYPNAPSVLIASAAGGLAGAIHAFAGAPADNVRLVLEAGLSPSHLHGAHSGWRQAWMEVFRQVEHVEAPRIDGTKLVAKVGGIKSRQEARQLRAWVKEVQGMARGWDGVWWGVGKDAVGFAVFFAVFDISRHLANSTAAYLDPTITLNEVAKRAITTTNEENDDDDEDQYSTQKATSKITSARVGHGVVLVTGGVAAGLGYEYVSRPFDNARRIVTHTTHTPGKSSDTFVTIMRIVGAHVREHGVLSLLRLPAVASAQGTAIEVGVRSVAYARAMVGLRALGRLGPWGIGFLMWEGFAPE